MLFTCDSSGVEYSCPQYDCYELPDFNLPPKNNLGGIVPPEQSGTQAAVKLFTAMVRRMQKEQAIIMREYKERCEEIHKFYQHDILERDVRIMNLRTQQLEDLEIAQKVGELWRARWSTLSEETSWQFQT